MVKRERVAQYQI